MKHLAILHAAAVHHDDQLEGTLIKATGRYYTHRLIGSYLVRSIWQHLKTVPCASTVSIIDPFAGDGRLPLWLVEHAVSEGREDIEWRVTCWDLDGDGLAEARDSCYQLRDRLGAKVAIDVEVGDAFRMALERFGEFDVVLTNPPWVLLKPDSRDLDRLGEDVKAQYIAAMREHDRFLTEVLPLSQPRRKFAGWGTNLARVGSELAMRLARAGGCVGIVSPASLLADDMSEALRRWMLTENSLVDAAYFPAEARLFSGADVSTAALVFERRPSATVAPRVSIFSKAESAPVVEEVLLPEAFLEENGYVVPISFGAHGIQTLVALSKHPSFGRLESETPEGLWAGRELDETRIKRWLGEEGDGLFVKGRMIDRFEIVEAPTERVRKPGWEVSPSSQYLRIAWRDVSRPSQKRRLKAALIPPGWIAGNSLGVAHFRDGDEERLRALLGLMSSLPFEFQLRSFLATGHVSLGALRKVHLPLPVGSGLFSHLAGAVARAVDGDRDAALDVEALAAIAFGLSPEDLSDIIEHFPKLTAEDAALLLSRFAEMRHRHRKEEGGDRPMPEVNTGIIPNHRTAKLSDLDMQVALAVPPGGNWKDVPESVPSKRLDSIRASYARGEGSRSTYYGRLRADRPAYTINTYFNRPGNGCHLHYDYDGGQHRVLSQREAARLQSFPDSFVFHGPQAAINKQIGNAVPPLLAFQIARTLGEPGYFVDLFAGAGGLGLGLKWAGWEAVVANEIEPNFVDTYRANVDSEVVIGDIRESAVFGAIVERVKAALPVTRGRPLWILGGPPCQGFSTAGKARTMEDARNHLFWNYRDLLDALQPDGFLFENVTGLLNMDGGETFRQVRKVLSETCDTITHWVLSADEHAVPQRRKRVFIIGRKGGELPRAPRRITSVEATGDLFGGRRRAVSVEEALGDLPALTQSEDGSARAYRSDPKTAYQELMRGLVTPAEYLGRMERGEP